MRATLPLGRWFGVPVGANAGILVILALIGVGLAVWHFPTAYPGRPAWSYALAGITAAVLLIFSILLHELAHAVVARASGIEVDQIVLWLLGGVAQLRGEPRSPRVDLAIAVVGPATSVLVGGMFGVAAALWLAVGGAGLIAATLVYLAAVNVVLAVFNLIPAAPLDGGRVLRAVWWRVTGDRDRAATAAAQAGRFFGAVLITLGIAGALFWGWLGGLWLALIGWFIVNAALAEERNAQVGRQLRGVRVRDVQSTDPVTAAGWERVADFIDQVVLRERHSTYPLVDAAGRLTGLVTLNRIRQVAPPDRERTQLQDIAAPASEVPTARADELLVDLLPRLADGSDNRAVVLDAEGRVSGVISPSDISRVAALAELRRGSITPA